MKINLNFIEPTPLCKIMGECESDKGNVEITKSRHNYTLLYFQLFEPIRDNNLRVFELGIGTNNISLPSNMGVNGVPGASLYGWKTFFPNAQIYGADIDKDILFTDERIDTFYCDQTSLKDITNLWNNDNLKEPFDIMIDDGLHNFYANTFFFEQSIHKLRVGGYYIIEDILESQYHLFQQKKTEWTQKYPNLDISLVKLPSLVNFIDNTLMIIYKKSIITSS